MPGRLGPWGLGTRAWGGLISRGHGRACFAPQRLDLSHATAPRAADPQQLRLRHQHGTLPLGIAMALPHMTRLTHLCLANTFLGHQAAGAMAHPDLASLLHPNRDEPPLLYPRLPTTAGDTAPPTIAGVAEALAPPCLRPPPASPAAQRPPPPPAGARLLSARAGRSRRCGRCGRAGQRGGWCAKRLSFLRSFAHLRVLDLSGWTTLPPCALAWNLSGHMTCLEELRLDRCCNDWLCAADDNAAAGDGAAAAPAARQGAGAWARCACGQGVGGVGGSLLLGESDGEEDGCFLRCGRCPASGGGAGSGAAAAPPPCACLHIVTLPSGGGGCDEAEQGVTHVCSECLAEQGVWPGVLQAPRVRAGAAAAAAGEGMGRRSSLESLEGGLAACTLRSSSSSSASSASSSSSGISGAGGAAVLSRRGSRAGSAVGAAAGAGGVEDEEEEEGWEAEGGRSPARVLFNSAMWRLAEGVRRMPLQRLHMRVSGCTAELS